MPANLKELAITKYYGLNNTTAPVNLGYEATTLQNFLIRELGKLTVRDGSTLVGNDTGALRQLGLTHWIDGATKVQIKVEGTVIQKLSSGTWSTMSGGTGLTTGLDMNFCAANGYLYGFNGTDDVRKINDTTVTTVAAMPIGTWAVWWRNILFVGGVAAYPNRVYFSAIGNPESFSVNDWFDIEPGDGDSLTGGIGLKDKILFAKSRAWYYLVGSGTNSFAVYPITYDFGACSYRSISNYGNDIWCVDMEGTVRSVLRNQYGLFNGADMSSEYLDETIARINLSELHNVCAGYKNGFLLFAVPVDSSTVNNLVLCYDGDAPVANGKSKWTTFTGWYPSVFDSFDSELYFAEGRDDGKVYSWSGNTDNGTAIACDWIGAQHELDSSGQKKRFMLLKWFGFPLGDYNATIKASIDEGLFGTLGSFNLAPSSPLWGAAGAVWGTGTWGVSGQVKDTFHYSTGGRVIGNKVQNELQYNSSNGPAEFGSHSIYYQVKRFRPN